jgi:1-acyl-sn-glycerol-3-phosphate acyltransferase
MMSALKQLLQFVYGLYALLLFVCLALLTFLLVLLPLGLTARRATAHFTSATFFRLAGIRVTVVDREMLPTDACVVVANHASYIDGVVMKAALPARFSFVIKKEVTAVPLAGLLLRRIGSEFVDRFNRHAGGMDARRLMKAAGSGQALAFFPEGTFFARPGVGKFHTGAFAIAARSHRPVVPVAIRGTRHILPAGRFLPRFGRIEILVLPPIPPVEQADAAAVAATRAQAHSRIVAALGEPDLSESDGIAQIEAHRKS